MSTITANEVKELRDKSGVGMMDCKKALQEANGDMDKAFDILDRYPQIKTLLDKIDTVEEFRQLIALSIIPYTGLYQKFKGVGDFEGKPNPGLKSQIQRF